MNGFYKFAIGVLRFVMPLWYKLETEGLENVPEGSGYLFVSNHRSNADPILIHLGDFSLRWYSFGFLFAFIFGYMILARMFKQQNVSVRLADSLVVYMFLAVLIGARLGHCLFYEPGYYLTAQHWWEMIIPISNGHFTGYQGPPTNTQGFWEVSCSPC